MGVRSPYAAPGAGAAPINESPDAKGLAAAGGARPSAPGATGAGAPGTGCGAGREGCGLSGGLNCKEGARTEG